MTPNASARLKYANNFEIKVVMHRHTAEHIVPTTVVTDL